LFASQKFSDQAHKWSTYAQEAYAMFFGFKTSEYYIRGKFFTYEGDHANLQWMERSTEAKIIRWRVYMQNFPFNFNHIPGVQNIVSDWQSRFEEMRSYACMDSVDYLHFVDSDSDVIPTPTSVSTETLFPKIRPTCFGPFVFFPNPS